MKPVYSRFPFLLLAMLLVPIPNKSAAGGHESTASARAQSWVGQDASQLLMALRVDGGRVKIEEDNATMETRYIWRTVTPAWTERIHVSGGELVHVHVRGNVHIPEYTPIVYDEIDHPEMHRCDVTYVADREGVVQRFDLSGPDCDADVVGRKGR